MKNITHSHTVKNFTTFQKIVRRLVQSPPNPHRPLYHCYVIGDTFTISSATVIQQFDFSHFKDEKTITDYIAAALDILNNKPPSIRPRLLLDDYTETIDILR